MKQENKYLNEINEYMGVTFHSKAERERYKDLVLMEKAGEIRDLKRQVKFDLLPTMRGKYRTERAVHYYADFTYYKVNPEGKDEYVVEDVKGVQTDLYKLKRKLMLYRKDISIYEVYPEKKQRRKKK